MDYNILQKIELLNGDLKYTTLGYISDPAKANDVNNSYINGFDQWVKDNKTELELGTKTLADYFNTTPECYHACIETNYNEGLTEITDVTPYI